MKRHEVWMVSPLNIYGNQCPVWTGLSRLLWKDPSLFVCFLPKGTFLYLISISDHWFRRNSVKRGDTEPCSEGATNRVPSHPCFRGWYWWRLCLSEADQFSTAFTMSPSGPVGQAIKRHRAGRAIKTLSKKTTVTRVSWKNLVAMETNVAKMSLVGSWGGGKRTLVT